MSVRVGGVVAVHMGSAAARPGLVARVGNRGPGAEPQLDLTVLVEIRFRFVYSAAIHGVPFLGQPGSEAGIWWQYGGPELYVRGPINLEGAPPRHG